MMTASQLTLTQLLKKGHYMNALQREIHNRLWVYKV